MPEQAPSNRPAGLPLAFKLQGGRPRRAAAPPAYAELLAASNFSFLHGASHPEELAAAASALGLAGFSVCDRNSLAGSVRGMLAAEQVKLRYAVGCRLSFRDGSPDVAAWPRDRQAYGRLCRLLTTGNLRAEKGECHLDLGDLLQWGEGMELAVIGDDDLGSTWAKTSENLAEAFPGSLRLGATASLNGRDLRRLDAIARMARRLRVPMIALGDTLYHAADRRPLQDVLTCIRDHVTLDEAGRRLEANAERHMKSGAEMAHLFRDHPDALAETLRVFERLSFSLRDIQYEYPLESAGASATPYDELVRLTWSGAAERYPAGLPDKVAAAIRHELAIIQELRYEAYFLTVWDIVRFAREEARILCQGRGSAANSAVCFCLKITEVDPERGDLLFERFISKERGEPPDIDVDFEHERREEVIQYIFGKYGRAHTALAATVITYRSRSAVREVGKVFGLSEDAVGALAGQVWGWSSDGLGDADVRRTGFDPEHRLIAQVLALSKEIIGFPRHLSQHVGGFVITRSRLDAVVPVLHSAMDGRTIIEWDKDDLEALGLLKIDVLALGMLTALKRALDMLKTHYGEALTLATIPAEEPEVYDMICRADTLGVFQIESRAQMSMLPRLKPRTFYDLVIEVAIVRPGPIQGDMVHPYLKRRRNPTLVRYPKPAPPHDPDELKKVLEKTLGVPLFQEQAMRIAIVAAKFEPWEADKLRRAMATFRRVGTISTFQAKMVEGMTARGYPADFAERCFRQIEGFGEYGFPESHAASFALLVYASSWVKCRYPDVFCAALLNAQPMGFYAPAQLVRDAREHGVEVRAVDVNFSAWDATLEEVLLPPPLRGRVGERGRPQPPSSWLSPHPALPRTEAGCSPLRCLSKLNSGTPEFSGGGKKHAVRLGFRQIKGLREADAAALIAARDRPFTSVRELWRRSGLSRAALERLADADAFRSLKLDRRAALWEVRALDPAAAAERLPLFSGAAEAMHAEAAVALPAMALGEHVVNDYRALSLSLKAHPVSFFRAELAAAAIVEARRLPSVANGRRISVAGLVLVRQRPGTAHGVIFATLEDETGVANVIVWPKIFERFRPVVLGARFLKVTGRLQSEQGVIHIVAERMQDLSAMLARLSEDSFGASGLARADEVRRPVGDQRLKVKPKSRLTRMAEQDPDRAAELRDMQRQAWDAMPKGRNFH